MIALVLCMLALGFVVEELPIVLRQRRLKRERKERAKALEVARVAEGLEPYFRGPQAYGSFTPEPRAPSSSNVNEARGLARRTIVSSWQAGQLLGEQAAWRLVQFGHGAHRPSQRVNPKTVHPPKGPSAVVGPRQPEDV